MINRKYYKNDERVKEMINRKYYKYEGKLFKISQGTYFNDSCKDIYQYSIDCCGEKKWVWFPRRLFIPLEKVITLETNKNSMEITEEQMNIEINKLEMMRELRK